MLLPNSDKWAMTKFYYQYFYTQPQLYATWVWMRGSFIKILGYLSRLKIAYQLRNFQNLSFGNDSNYLWK